MKKVTWEQHDGEIYALTRPIVEALPPGVYYHYSTPNAFFTASVNKAESDQLFDLPGLPTSFILDQIATFWTKKEEYARYGFFHKRGILLYGPPGCGKTSIINLLKERIIHDGGVVFLATNGFYNLTRGITDFRKIEPERPIMTLVEDLENAVAQKSDESAALAFYDGERQFNNIVHVATTNKPDLLEDRFIKRPGRFDLVVGLHAPSKETREGYLKNICNGHLTQDQTRMIVDKTEGLGLSVLREIASTYLVLGIPVEETITRLKGDNARDYKKAKTGYTIGFASETTC